MTAALTTPDAVLDAAADYFAADPDRWGRDAFIDRETHCRCAMGGIAYVIDPLDWDANPTQMRNWGKTELGRQCVLQLSNYLVDYYGVEPHIDDNVVTIVSDWNDERGRSASDVVMLLRATAADYRKRQAERAARERGAA